MLQRVVLAVALLALTGCMQRADAYAKNTKLIPNGDNVPNAPAIGHSDPTGSGGTNAFGDAFKRAGEKWTKELCMADSDGDGFTNGQEMGDPCCTWTPTSTAGLITDGISHPSDKTKTPTNAKLTAGCSTTGAAASGSSTTALTTAPTTASASSKSLAAPATTVLAACAVTALATVL